MPTSLANNRITAAKKPIKKLPTTVEITDKTTVQDVKVMLAKQAGGKDPNRLGIFDPEKKKILKDRKALISQHKEVMAGQEILIKDLGSPPLSLPLLMYPMLTIILGSRTPNLLANGLHNRIRRPYPNPPLLPPPPTIHLLHLPATLPLPAPLHGHHRPALRQARI